MDRQAVGRTSGSTEEGDAMAEYDEIPLDDRVMQAMAEVPRADFLPESVKHLAHYDGPLPIGESQTNSQPYTVAFMLTLLDVQPGLRILDVGSGSGWTTALLARLVGESGTVWGVERRAPLIERAREALAKHAGFDHAGAGNRPSDAIHPNTVDHASTVDHPTSGGAHILEAASGTLGLPEEAPFDRILVSAAAPQIPDVLCNQLADEGIMVIPVATTMKRVMRRDGGVEISNHGAFRFVPLVED
ncbi:MAG: protein-L-isoaspartate O-methyltransferase [Ancrocorticia sp.]|uniref:protein-L-isoaspartate O-methyltransferase n=1 Tax=Ancrocorticia sp. TaxID=2593684 RepID=UPI003F8F0401